MTQSFKRHVAQQVQLWEEVRKKFGHIVDVDKMNKDRYKIKAYFHSGIQRPINFYQNGRVLNVVEFNPVDNDAGPNPFTASWKADGGVYRGYFYCRRSEEKRGIFTDEADLYSLYFESPTKEFNMLYLHSLLLRVEYKGVELYMRL